MSPLDLEGINEDAVSAAEKLGADDAVALSARSTDKMIRFANSTVTVVNHVEEAELTVYLAKNRRRAIASTSNLESASIRKFVRDLFDSMKGLPVSEYVPLPDKAQKFSPSKVSYDKKLDDVGEVLPELAKTAITSSHAAGGKRSAGVIDAGVVTYAILTSTGTRGTDARTSITLNIRSFAQKDASGHGLSCSSTLSGFDPTMAGERAGCDAKKMVEASEPEAGTYEVLLSPTVAANIIETVAASASAFSVDAGTSYLAEKLNRKVAAQDFNLTDHGTVAGGLGGRVFDDEGTRTSVTPIIQEGVLKQYLHNLTTARKWKTRTTGSAGFVTPRPWNLEVGKGDSSFDEMVREMKRGIVLTSNWYTRFKNYRTGEFSTVPRDGAYLVENGEVARALKGMRAGDDLQRILSSVRLLSRGREWIEWWEVDTPTLCPWVLVDGVKITRAYE
ncbi:MAG: TldD/PmbA family protein [Thaumarchaeota archaeon]|nr:TldD/PmbA family protein [Nitrososphaerota archaeon]